MREIIFRGLCPITNKMVYGALDNRHNVPRILSFENEEQWTQVYPESVSQYTGLKDKNGKKIYEGDIVKIDTGAVCKVVCLNTNAGFELYGPKKKWYFGTHRTKEVIGNIYENPDLLDNV